MKSSENEIRRRAIFRITFVGSAVNLLLVVCKLLAGVFGHSAAMLADGVHSLSDFITDVVVLLFVRLSDKPVDKDHDYGHGKYETLGTAVIGLALVVAGLLIMVSSLRTIFSVVRGAEISSPDMLALWVALLSIVAKELLFHATNRVGVRYSSSAVVANAWHHRSDAFSSIGTALGIGGAILLGPEWRILDPLAAFIVGLFILRMAVKLSSPCMDELLEKSLPDEVENEILNIVQSFHGVSHPHNLCTRRLGNRYAIEIHIRMDGNITLHEAHETATAIECKLRERFGEGTHIGIHVEPGK